VKKIFSMQIFRLPKPEVAHAAKAIETVTGIAKVGRMHA
jgi:hypothetical protein